MSDQIKVEEATFGAGCFWGVEEVFRRAPGVLDTEVGFMGGHVDKVTYKEVCQGDTGHAEVVHLKFDPSIVSYEQLLDIFWSKHNPTTLNRQGPDVGSQYRSIIFYNNEEQRQLAERSKEDLGRSGKYEQPIVTEIVPAAAFWRAEDYHQKYIMKGGRAACAI